MFAMTNRNVSIPIKSAGDLGIAIRAMRRAQGLRQDDLAGSAHVGKQVAMDVEHGVETVEWGRVLRLLREVGIDLYAEVTPDALAELDLLQKKGLRPLNRRRRAAYKRTSQ